MKIKVGCLQIDVELNEFLEAVKDALLTGEFYLDDINEIAYRLENDIDDKRNEIEMLRNRLQGISYLD